MFSNKDLRNLIVPLFVEQFLLMFVGIADTFVVSFSSEADVSGVSLDTVSRDLKSLDLCVAQSDMIIAAYRKEKSIRKDARKKNYAT